MSVSVECDRRRKPQSDTRDYLAVSVALKKGERGGLQLHDAQVRLQSCLDDSFVGPKRLLTIGRLDRFPEDSPNTPAYLKGAEQLDWNKTPPDVPRLNLPPGDATQLAACFEVDALTPYVVEVAILGRTFLFKSWKRRFGQWRAAAISLPTVSPGAR
jgi:hypothetical protein